MADEGFNHKWSAIAPVVRGVVAEAVDGYQDMQVVFAQTDRFKTLGPSDREALCDTSLGRPVDPSRTKTQALEWAARYNRKWFSAQRKMGSDRHMANILMLHNASDAVALPKLPSAWLRATTYSYSGLMIKCEIVIDDDTPGSLTIRMANPTVCSNSMEVFAALYDRCGRTGDPSSATLVASMYEIPWSTLCGSSGKITLPIDGFMLENSPPTPRKVTGKKPKVSKDNHACLMDKDRDLAADDLAPNDDLEATLADIMDDVVGGPGEHAA